MPDTHAVLPDTPGIEAAGLWLSISALAARKGVSKQALSERIGRLVGDQKLTLRPGPRRSKLVNVAQFDRAVGECGDPAKEAGAALMRSGSHPDVPAGEPSPPALDGVSAPGLLPDLLASTPAGSGAAPKPEAAGPSPYRDAAAREKAYRADLAELDLLERLGKVVPIEDVTDAMVTCAKKIGDVIRRLPLREAELLASATNEGSIGVRRVLKAIVFEQLTALADAMKLLADTGVEHAIAESSEAETV